MDLYDLFELEEQMNPDEMQSSTSWFDTFIDATKRDDRELKRETTKGTCLDSISAPQEDDDVSMLPDSFSFKEFASIDNSGLDDNLTWIDFNFDPNSSISFDGNSWCLSMQNKEQSKTNTGVEFSGIHSPFILNTSLGEEHKTNDDTKTELILSNGVDWILRNTRKRQAFNPYERYENILKRATATPSTSGRPSELLILPNGEVFRRVKLPDIETAIGAPKSTLSDPQPNSPSGSSDSGLSISPHHFPESSPEIPQGYVRSLASNDFSLPAYTLSEALFAEPPLRKGVLILTDEEKNCLTAHGHPIPGFLPLDKEQEKYLKKIRRKIKNKVAAQESRRRRKEYTDMLESKMKLYQDEKRDLLEKLKNLENYNSNLMSQIKALSEKVRLTHPTKEGTCLMVVVLFFALFVGSWDFKSWNIGYGKVPSTSSPGVQFLGSAILGPNLPNLHRMLEDQKEKVLSHGPIIEHPLVENYFDIKTTSDSADTESTDSFVFNQDSFPSNVKTKEQEFVCLRLTLHASFQNVFLYRSVTYDGLENITSRN